MLAFPWTLKCVGNSNQTDSCSLDICQGLDDAVHSRTEGSCFTELICAPTCPGRIPASHLLTPLIASSTLRLEWVASASPPSPSLLFTPVNGLCTTRCLLHGGNWVLTFSTQMDGSEAFMDSICVAVPGCWNLLQLYWIQAQLLSSKK